jgi:iron complex transport system substrate-binding protein
MKKIVIFCCAFFLFTACSNHAVKEVDGTKDMRIVSLSKHLTEFAFALGKGHDLVGVDWSSTYPDSAKSIAQVGYHRALNPEGIIALHPDIVIHSNDIGPATILPQIEKAGLTTKVFGNANTIDSAKMLLHEMGNFFGRSKVADSLCKILDYSLGIAVHYAQQLNTKDTPSVMIIHFGRANNVYFVMSGRNGVADKMIEMAGAKVAHYDAKGAKQLSPEAIAIANPDIIIATDYGFDKMGNIEKFIEDIPGVKLTNAGKKKKIIRFEEHDLTYFGPRSGSNLIALIHLLHPTSILDKK